MSSHRYTLPRRSGARRRVVALGVAVLVLGGAAVGVVAWDHAGPEPAGPVARDTGPSDRDARKDPSPKATPSPAPTRKPTRSPAPTTEPPATQDVPRADPLAESPPDRLVVPSLGLDADVMDLGLAGDGTLEVPPGAFPAGWYTGSPTPGELGPAVVAGHVSWNGTPGVFEDLDDLGSGDSVEVVREDGSTAQFVVTRTEDYDKDEFPTEAVYGDLDHAGLRLITCGGLDPASGVYEDNVVVFADLVGGA